MTHAQNRNSKIHELVLLAMFSGILLLLAFTPIGLIDLPLIKATILHVPVIIGSILLGPKKGAFLGFVFGLTSILKNTMVPSVLSFAFSPLIPVPGLNHGSPWALIICFVPRILVGVTPWLVFQGAARLFGHKSTSVRISRLAFAAVVGAFTNTVLVMGLIFLLFRQPYALMNGIPVDAVLGVILGIVGANGLPEAIVAAVITPAVCLPLTQVLKLDIAAPDGEVNV